MNKSEDRRVRKTQRLIENTLADLMLEKPLQEITVMELTARADINRGTFYLHYKDIYDLFLQIEDALLCQLKEALQRRNPQELRKDTSLKFVDVFTFLFENQTLARIILNGHGDAAFLDTVKATLEESAFSTWDALYGSDGQNLYDSFFTFGISGCIGLAQRWLADGCPQTPEEMGKMCNSFLEHGRGVLIKQINSKIK